MGLSVVKPFPQ